MHGTGLLKHFTLVALATSTSLFAYHYVANASVYTPQLLGSGDQDFSAVAGTPAGYSLPKLRLLNRTMYFIDDKYVDPARIHPDEMFDAALDAAERLVPEVMFQREPGGTQLHISAGSYATTLTLPVINSTRILVEQLQRVATVLDGHLSGEIALPDVEYAFINGVLSTLDPHSILLPPEESQAMEVDNAGEFGGLGINITSREGKLIVERPLPETPASKADLQADDQIVRIDGESTVNMDLDEAVSKLRGKVGTPVTITVHRESWDKDKEITIIRDKIKINPVVALLLDGGVGYVRINNFHAAVSADLTRLLAELRVQNNGQELRGLVLDLRGNPGGFLHQAVEVSDLFLSTGSIVSTVERGNQRVDSRTATKAGTEPNYSMVVLVDASSASASEIVAGALVNNGRAVVVGERTFGKGSVQNLYKNDDESQLKLTVARYLLPNDRSIQSVGVPADVLLQPTIVDVIKDKESGRTDPAVAMYFREQVRREADLDHHFNQTGMASTESVYNLRYLQPIDKEAPRNPDLDAAKDWDVQFSRDLLLAAPAYSNRAEILASIGTVISGYQTKESAAIANAFKGFGVDWSEGPQATKPSLKVELDLGPDGVLKAGEANEEMIQVKVTNTGTEPLYQVMAVSDSTLRWLDGDEFFFGKLAPGETRVWPKRVRMLEGYRDEVGKVTLNFQDAQRTPLASSEHLVRTIGQPLPHFSWDYSLADSGVKGTHGDGDGIAEPGEVVALTVHVTNDGPGATTDAYARLKNRAAKALDLQQGVAELGVIAPGKSADAVFLFKVLGGVPDLPVELRVGDADRYDYAAVWEGGFYDFANEVQQLSIPVGRAMPKGSFHSPTVEITRAPKLIESNDHVVLTGVAKDDKGLRDVIIYRGGEEHSGKVFYQGGDGTAQALPFTVEAELEPGSNLFVVLVRDADGLTAIRSVEVWRGESSPAELATLTLPMGG